MNAPNVLSFVVLHNRLAEEKELVALLTFPPIKFSRHSFTLCVHLYCLSQNVSTFVKATRPTILGESLKLCRCFVNFWQFERGSTSTKP